MAGAAGEAWPFVTVLLVNYCGRSWLPGCLTSIYALDYPREQLEVWLVDNDSSDDSLAYVEANYPQVRIDRARRNCGFALGNNRGFRVARGAWVALINIDARVEPEWLKLLVAAGEREPDLGGVTGQLRFLDTPDRINSTGLELLADGRGRDRDLHEPTSQLDRPAGEVFGGCGAGLLLRRELIEQLGGFDERFFMYYEDLDLAWRGRLLGWRFAYVPEAIGTHAGSASAGLGSPLQLENIEANRVAICWKNGPLWLALWTSAGFCLRGLRTGLRWLRGEPSLRPAHLFATLRAAVTILTHWPLWLADRHRYRTSQPAERVRRAERWMQPHGKAA